MPNAETLPLLLKQLRLPAIYKSWKDYANKAEEHGWTYPEYLSALSDLEATARCNARINRHIKESKLPPGKTIDKFNFKEVPSVNAAHIKALCESPDWVRRAENVVMFGPSGVGKTHLAASIGYSLINHGMRVLFTSATELVQRLQLARNDYKLPQILDKLSRVNVLILDDIAYVKKSEMETSVLFELIAERYETNSIIITANQPFSEWDQIFPDSMMAVAAVDRIIHHSTIINIEGDSYRKRESSKQKKDRR